MSVANLKMSDKMSVKAICSLHHGGYTVYHHFLCNRSNKGHGSGCTTALSGMRNYFYCVYCLTPPISLCYDNTQNLRSSTVERIPKQNLYEQGVRP